jgi:hypothetical protein
LEITEKEAIDCGSAPYVSKEASATFLESSPCFKRGQVPGKYSLECLQQTFVGAGCTEQGEAYPNTQAKAQALMTGPGGKLLTVGQIGGIVYEKSLTAYTGLRADGSKMPVKEWDEVSRFCTGKSITSPCDFDNKDSGPLSNECLSYLWKNTGAVENKPGNVGSTYSSSSRNASLDNQNDRFCTPRGTMAPIDASGKPNDTAIAAARAKGGVNAVKEFYNQIHLKANDNTQTDDARKEAVMQCYGVEFRPVESTTSNETVNVAGASMPPQTIIDSLQGPTRPTENRVVVKENWIISFRFTPTGTQTNWTSIFHISTNGTDWSGAGSRVPGLWFFPNSTQIRVHIAFKGNESWYMDATVALPQNQETAVTLSCIGQTVTMKFSGAVTSSVSKPVSGTKPTGRAILYTPDPWWPSFKGTLANLSYATSDNEYPSVLDYKPGRTKSSQQTFNYSLDPPDWSGLQCPAVELGPYGMAPWGTNWVTTYGGITMPDDGTIKWIWVRAGANNNEPSWNTMPFYKKYTNPTNEPIRATLYVAADNIGWIGFNDETLASDFATGRAIDFTIPVGESSLHINASNQGGPAGLAVICKEKNTNKTLFVSDRSWLILNQFCNR